MSTEKIVKKIISTKRSPKPMGPYSQAVVVGRTIYVSGVIGVDKEHKLVEGGVRAQIIQTLINLETILEDVNSCISKALKLNVFVKNLDDMFDMKNGMGRCLGLFSVSQFAAMSMFQVERLPMDALVEIDCIGLIEDVRYM